MTRIRTALAGLAIIAALAVLPACTDLQVAKTAEIGCDAAIVAMDGVTEKNNLAPFPKAQQTQYAAWGDKVGEVCLATKPPTTAQLADVAFQTAAHGLKAVSDGAAGSKLP